MIDSQLIDRIIARDFHVRCDGVAGEIWLHRNLGRKAPDARRPKLFSCQGAVQEIVHVKLLMELFERYSPLRPGKRKATWLAPSGVESN